MKFLGFLTPIVLLITSPVLIAAGPVDPKSTAKEKVVFAPSTEAAFDRSGDRITHSTLADGSLVADYNGSMGSVTVARMAADGTIETLCTSDEAAARAFMAGDDNVGDSKPLSVPVMAKSR